MKFNWNQTGMPVTLVAGLRPRNEFCEFKSVLSEARNYVMTPVDAEAMARELVASGGREYVELVKELAGALADAKKELETVSRRYGQMTAELDRRGICLDQEEPQQNEAKDADEKAASDVLQKKANSPEENLAEWEEWNRKFESLLK